MTDPFLDLAEANVQKLKHLPRIEHPALENARVAVEQDWWILQRRDDEWRETNRIWRALMLSPNREICEALLQGQPVPLSRLDPIWLERFGIPNREVA